MTTKELYLKLEGLISTRKKDYVTYAEIMSFFEKRPTMSNTKKLLSFLKKYDVKLITSAELAKRRNVQEAKKREEDRKKVQVQTETTWQAFQLF